MIRSHAFIISCPRLNLAWNRKSTIRSEVQLCSLFILDYLSPCHLSVLHLYIIHQCHGPSLHYPLKLLLPTDKCFGTLEWCLCPLVCPALPAHSPFPKYVLHSLFVVYYLSDKTLEQIRSVMAHKIEHNGKDPSHQREVYLICCVIFISVNYGQM